MELRTPRRPRIGAQRRIARRSPDRVHVVAGEPATVYNLRRRFHDAAETGTFVSYVRRQAVLACERAELAVIGDRYKVPQLVVEQVTSSAEFQRKVRGLASELDRPEADVLEEAKTALSSLVTVQSRLTLDLSARVNRVFYERAWNIGADTEQLDRLRELNKSQALVFLPSHRSYLDPLVLADVLTAHDFPRNHTLGGDNMSFGPLGALARRSGVVFIRRKFDKDPVYRMAARSYLSFLVGKRFNLEWYPEGGRSRTGKLRSPMLGLLAYLVDAVEEQPGLDVTIVPTSIVYDQLGEIAAMAAEDSGGSKKSENMRWLVRYARSQRRSLGDARVRFGEPFSLRDALDRAGEGPARVDKVAFEVMDGINRATPITATSLAAFTLLGAEPRAFTHSEIEAIIEPLLDYIDRRGLPGPDPDRCRGTGLNETLDVLTSNGVLSTYSGGPEQVWSVAAGNHAVAAYYRNGTIHHFVNRAITELTLLSAATAARRTPPERPYSALREALKLRSLLEYEFYFPDKVQFADELVTELDLVAPNWRELGGAPEDAQAILRQEDLLLARRTLQPFIDAQLVVAEQLVEWGERSFDEGAFLDRCLTVGRQQLLQNRIRTPESVSRELYAGAVRLATHRGLLDGAEPGVDTDRRRLADEIRAVRDQLAVVETLENSARFR